LTITGHPHHPSSGQATDLRAAWREARSHQPMARPYDVARALGVSELELVSAELGGPEVTRLRLETPALFDALARLGPVMALTRNPHAVIETHGAWAPFAASGDVGIVHGDAPGALDLRLFLGAFRHALAVRSEAPRGTRRSIQLFGQDGVALHKVFVLEGQGDAVAFEALVEAFAADDQVSPPLVTPRVKEHERPDGEIDVAGFQAAWRALTDTHHFYPMTRRFGVTRTQALRLAPAGHARPCPTSAVRGALERASREGLPVMVFVGNEGCLEIHSGVVKNVKVLGDWLNVLDPAFNLHLRQDAIASAWVVTKPTSDGDVTSLEAFAADGQLILMMFGVRKPGQPEDAAWRTLAAGL